MNILLIGGTGMVGSRIANEATERGHSVTIVTRSGDNNTEKADATDTQQLAKLAAKQEAVVVAVSPPRDGSDPTAPCSRLETVLLRQFVALVLNA